MVLLPRGNEQEKDAKLVMANPGDLILWDSRLLHCGHVGRGKPDSAEWLRLSFTVCMLPKQGVEMDVLQDRRAAVSQGLCLTHWPSKCEPHSFSDSDASALPKDWRSRYTVPQLSREQQLLIDGEERPPES